MMMVALASGLALRVIDSAFSKDAFNASQSGRRLETLIAGIFRQADVEIKRASDFEEVPKVSKPGDHFVVRNAPYRSIYGHAARIEFLLFLNGASYLIETKRMSVSGSVDEKLPLVWLNAKHNQRDHQFLLIVDGDGWKPEARAWIEARARSYEGFDVMGVEGFKIWLSLSAPDLTHK